MLPALALQTYEIVLIIVAVFILFGGVAQIPKLARALGRAKGEYQVARRDFEGELKATEDQAQAARAAAAGAAAPGAGAPAVTTAYGGAPAAAPTAAPAATASEAQVRDAARALGIAAEGRSVDELRRDIERRLQ